MSPTGKTKDAGWQIGVSRTVAKPVDDVWQLLTSERGVRIWLGGGVSLPTIKGASYTTDDGTTGQIRSYRPNRIRLTWRPADWTYESTIQVAVAGDGAKASIRFHQERRRT